MTKGSEAETGRDTADRKGAGPRRRHPLLHAVILGTSFVVVFSIASIVVAAGFVLQERPLVAPSWMKEKVEARLDRTLEGLSVDFGEIAVTLGEGGMPRLQLRELHVQRAGSAARLTLSNLEGTLALGPLLRGQMQPDAIYLSGAQMLLKRDAEGRFDLAFGEGGVARSEGTPEIRGPGNNLGGLADEVEALLDLPDLKGLRRIEATALTLRYEDARANRAWTVDGGRAVLERDGAELRLRGDFTLLSGRAWASTLSLSYASRIGEKAAQFAMDFEDVAARDLATQSAALTWLEVLDAPASGNLRVAVDDAGLLGPLNARLSISEGELRPAGAAVPVPFDMAEAYFTYDPAAQSLQVSEYRLDSEYVTARGEGMVHLLGTEGGRPREMVSQMRLSQFSARPGSLLPEPVELGDVHADFQVKLDPFEVNVGRLALDHGGEQLALSGRVRASPEGWDVSAEGAMSAITPEALVALWPANAAARTREWIEKNVYAGEMRNLQLGLRLLPGAAPDVFAGFEIADAEMNVARGLPPATGVNGHASWHHKRFVAVLEKGEITAPQGGRVALDGTVLVVPDTRIKPAPAELRLKTESTVTAMLALMDSEPYRMLAKAGKPVTLADGRLALDGVLEFPLKKRRGPGDYVVDVSGRVTDMRSDVLVPGRRLAANALDLKVTGKLLTLEGDARIGAVPVGGRYELALGPDAGGAARLDGWVEVSERFADEFRIGLPPGTLSGQGRARVLIEMAKDTAPRFRVTSDLAGIGLRLAALNWSLPRAARGELVLAGEMGRPARIDTLSLDAPGLDAEGTLALDAEGGLEEARFGRVRIGGWFDGPVTLTGRGTGQAPAVAVTGGTVDLRRTELSQSRAAGSGGPVRLELDRLQVSDTIALTGFRGDFNTGGGLNGTFSGNVNGAAPVTGIVVPRNGRSAVRITARDAGRVLKATNLLKQGHHGTLDLQLSPVGGPGNYDGQLVVRGLNVREAPAMAALLNRISVVGLVDEMAGRGIVFDDVEARFRLTPRQVVVTRSSAVGTSLGISMDGVYDLASGRMDMQGVISPVYMLNGIGSVLTRKGEGLFGFAYTLSGSAKAPKVGVNPLSLLTPGMFREIFRRPPPRVGQAQTQ
ncbi:MAG: hypothetical protein ACU0DK_06785 [Pseudooceanicola sp.]